MDIEKLKHIRVISHIDLDAFYAQVEQNRNPKLRDASVAVIQYNPFGDLKTHSEEEERIFNDSHGSIIAISYGDARKQGVKRGMRGGEARKLCQSLQLVQVPTLNGKADLTLYRKHGQDVLNMLAEPDNDSDAAMARLLKHHHPWRDSNTLPVGIDAIHIGCTGHSEKGTDVVIGSREWFCRPEGDWCAAELLLAHGAAIVAEKRARVYSKLGYTVSAGVAHTKLLAKLCSGLNKPNMQTVVPQSSVMALLRDLPLQKLRGLGGGFGQRVQASLGVSTVGDLARLPVAQLQKEFGEEQGMWLHRMAHGEDGESVSPRLAVKSIGCGKSFRAHLLITSVDTAHHWLGQLANEMQCRLQEDHEEHRRRATRLILHIGCKARHEQHRGCGTAGGHKSIGAPLPRHTAATISSVATQLFRGWTATAGAGWVVSGLSLSASAFSDAAAGSADLRSLFSANQRLPTPSKAPSKAAAGAPPAQQGGPPQALQALPSAAAAVAVATAAAPPADALGGVGTAAAAPAAAAVVGRTGSSAAPPPPVQPSNNSQDRGPWCCVQPTAPPAHTTDLQRCIVEATEARACMQLHACAQGAPLQLPQQDAALRHAVTACVGSEDSCGAATSDPTVREMQHCGARPHGCVGAHAECAAAVAHMHEACQVAHSVGRANEDPAQQLDVIIDADSIDACVPDINACVRDACVHDIDACAPDILPQDLRSRPPQQPGGVRAIDNACGVSAVRCTSPVGSRHACQESDESPWTCSAARNACAAAGEVPTGILHVGESSPRVNVKAGGAMGGVDMCAHEGARISLAAAPLKPLIDVSAVCPPTACAADPHRPSCQRDVLQKDASMHVCKTVGVKTQPIEHDTHGSDASRALRQLNQDTATARAADVSTASAAERHASYAYDLAGGQQVSAVALAALPADIRSEVYLAQGGHRGARRCDRQPLAPKRKVQKVAGSAKPLSHCPAPQPLQKGIKSFFCGGNGK